MESAVYLPPPQKLILKNYQSPGDIVMLTAAVRDLHRARPGRYVTDVRTSCPALWEHNPYITPIADDDPEAISIQCDYPAIHRSNEEGRHFIWGFMEDLERKLNRSFKCEDSSLKLGVHPGTVPGKRVSRSEGRIRPTEFKGDIHLSDEERGWMSQIEEVTGISPEAEPYWIIVAGGKWDYTIKWWGAARWQTVAEEMRNRYGVRLVQIGATGAGHYHIPLRGGPWMIDLLGKTDMRQLVRLMYHAQGVVCPVTFAMHLAAAVPLKRSSERERVDGDGAGDDDGRISENLLAHARCYTRPCVVVAGGREPPHWEAYPGHQFLHTVGTLPCCDRGGCWRARTTRLGDGDAKDKLDQLCVDVAADSGLPRCMDKITPEDVLRAVGRYF